MRSLHRIAVACALASALVPGSAASEPSLFPFHSERGAFRAAFPSEPRYDEDTELTLLGRLAEARRLALRCPEGRRALELVSDLQGRPEQARRWRDEARRLERGRT